MELASLDDQPQYVCGRCNDIFIEGNLTVCYGENSQRIEFFYCNNCFIKIFEIKENTQDTMEDYGQEDAWYNEENEICGEGCPIRQVERSHEDIEEGRKEE